MSIDRIGRPGQTGGVQGGAAAGRNISTGNADFQELLRCRLEEDGPSLNFSRHAAQRINDRQIDMTPDLLGQVTDAVDRAEEKGIHDALILGSDAAFIVNIPSRTIITTMNGVDMNSNVFTNIDGTVLL